MTAHKKELTEEEIAKHENRKHWIILLTKIFCVIAVIYLLYWLIWGRFDDYTNDAYVNGNQVILMARTPGTIVSINTDDTQFVKTGAHLIELDKTDNAVALEQAKADLAETVRHVNQYYQNVFQTKAALRACQANLLLAEQNLERRKGLVGDLAISPEEMQTYTLNAQATKAQCNLIKHKLNAAVQLVQNTHLYTHPEVKQAEARLKKAYLAYVRTEVNAPTDGIVAKRRAQIGSEVNANTPLLAIVPIHQMWVDANYKETQLKRIRIGQAAEITADMNDYTYHGKVVGLSPGTGNAFSLLPPQNATGNWIKIVQRLPVRIALDSKELAKHPLKIGVSTEVTVFTRHKKGRGLALVTKGTPLYFTDIYAKELNDANQIIKQILVINAPHDITLPATYHDL